jgi:hypothetical protein
MHSDDMKLLNEIYIRTLENGVHIYDNTNNNIKIAQKLESYASYLTEMNEKIKRIVDITNNYANECINKANAIRELITTDNPKYLSTFSLYSGVYKGLSWGDIDEIEETRENIVSGVDDIIKSKEVLSKYNNMPILYKTISSIYGKDLGDNLVVPIINHLDDMPASLYWYRGDVSHPEGIYMCLSNGYCIQVPFPDIIDSKQNSNKQCSVKCKYTNIDECIEIRKTMAVKYKSQVRECNFAHTGDSYNKISNMYRTPNLLRFGHHNTIKYDMEIVSEEDINTMLMYSLSDVLLGSVWLQNHKDYCIMTNIDIC